MRQILTQLGAILLGLAAAGMGAAQTDPVVAVTGGQVKGRALDGGAVFKGIPFAQPPTGDLRWREPMPVKTWSGARDAGQYQAPCAQIAAGWNDKAAAIGREDCLYLNVWTSEWPSKSRKPVMFWIHGGANMGGTALGLGGIEPPFDGARLAARGVVVVTIQYRLGMFGFLAHPELTAESPHHSSGNYGILDQVAALKWVRENIARFGGDPGNVTVFGQSAGALDTGLLLTSPLASGLFHRAIAESGTVVINGNLTPSLASKEKAGLALAQKMNAPASGALKHLRSLSEADVLKASPPYGGGGELRPEPIVDGYAITQLPARQFLSGGELGVPLIIGNNGRERAIPGGPEGLKKAIEQFYGTTAAKAWDLYAGNVSSYPPYGDLNAQYGTDIYFRCGAATIALWHSGKFPTYQYEFTRGYEPEGAVHSWELRYVFGNLMEPYQEADRKLSDQMMQYWANFAKTGNPNGGSLAVWPKYDAARRGYLEFSAEGPVAKTALRVPFCDVFAETLKQRMVR
jgi:para-nitrobenzyl esterase